MVFWVAEASRVVDDVIEKDPARRDDGSFVNKHHKLKHQVNNYSS